MNQHPKALPFLFLTEMWERFGFYIVQGLLVIYMTKSLGFSDNDTFTISGAFAGLAYVSPWIGGWLAGRFIGFKTAIIYGGIFLILGYALLASLSTAHYLFYLALATIIVGTGLFKPNISSLLGILYSKDSSARDSGFTIFYIGINLGVLLSSMGGYVKDHFGWHVGFALASLGLFIGLLTFIFAVGLLHIKDGFTSRQVKNFFLKPIPFILGCIIFSVLISFLLQNNFLAKWLLPAVGVFLLLFLFVLTLKQDIAYRSRMVTLIILILFSILFWMLFLQIFFSANLFIDRLVDKTIFGLQIPSSVFYGLEAGFIILFGPALAWSWQALNMSGKNPSPVSKFVVGIFLAGLAFVALAVSTYFPNASHLVSPLWIVLAYWLLTIGELMLSPIGLSAVTLLSPPKLAGLMMGIWFVALGFGGEFGGWLAKLASVPETLSNTAMLPIYRSAFLDEAYIAFGSAVVLFILQYFLRKKG